MRSAGEGSGRLAGLKFRRAVVCAAGAFALAASASLEVRAQTSAVDPDAVEILRRSMEYVGNLPQFSVDAQTTFEDVLDSGHRVDFELSGTALVSRPNKLRTERHGDGIDQIFYYDGETLTLFNPADNMYATEPAPSTIEEMFQFVYDWLGIGTPISDLVHHDVFPLLMQDVTFAIVVGKEVIRGVRCDHVLFSRPDVDFQMWVADSGPPLPLKYVVTDTTTPELLSVSAFMSNWNLDPDVTDASFTFAPPDGAKAINFLKAETISDPDP